MSYKSELVTAWADAMFSSKREDWNTPENLLEAVREFGPIGLDPCSNENSIVAAAVEWRLERDGDSLLRPWAGHGLVFVNPPYGRVIRKWTEKMKRESAAAGAEIIALVPARTDAKWFQGSGAVAACLWRGRLKFLGAPSSAPFPSALLYYGDSSDNFIETFAPFGLSVLL